MADIDNDYLFVDKEYQLKKFSGKGGWTYAEIPEIPQDKKAPFGWVKVSGSIDTYKLKSYKLMPMGNGKLFLPVKAAIRKQIGKEAGDFVSVKLYKDDSPIAIPSEIIECLNNESQEVYSNFMALTEGEQKYYLDWIYATRNEDTKAIRIVNLIDRLSRNKKHHKSD